MNDGACNCGNPGHNHDGNFDADLGTSLHDKIDFSGVRALNEEEEGSCRGVLKSYTERLEREPHCSSDPDDGELIIHVPFGEAVKMKFLSLTGGDGGTAPSKVRLFVNRDDVDFSNVHDLEPAQELALVDPDAHPGYDGTLDYKLKASMYNSVSSLTMFFPEPFGEEQTTIHYIGFKGEGTNTRHGVVDAVYEARPVHTDHKTPSGENAARQLGD
ncbi:hypothetical protein TeGR_g5555 [Tetraparma gracilis]|uniref:PITH domain-containing protein n=1 Tax=Tetraparma gracilis TaxID=2962635 RepID=A0ABQ6MHX3_9STRA|nr:hypothetical protein TeGR_g5555 [Tetraparma gracilis]